jgi:hypothetical protein
MSWDELFKDPEYMKKNEREKEEEEDWSDLSDNEDDDEFMDVKELKNEIDEIKKEVVYFPSFKTSAQSTSLRSSHSTSLHSTSLHSCQSLIDKCSELSYFPKLSKSDTIILFGKYDKLPIVIKIAFMPLNILNNSLIIEEQIYRNIITNLLYNNHTPHLVEYINSIEKCQFSINTFTSKLSSRDKEIFILAINGLKTDYFDEYNFDQSVITILKQSEKTTLADVLDNRSLSTDNIFILLFQLLYTLLVFNSIGLIHNDLHFRNIFVNQLDDEIILNYKWKDNIFSIKTRYMIKIFDWDRGSIYHPAVQRNFELDVGYCIDFGQCNGLTFNDYEGILSMLIFYCENKYRYRDVLEWVKAMTPRTYDIFKNREYKQIKEFNETKIYPESDLVPLHKAFENVKNILEEKKLINRESKYNEIVYTIPKEKKFIFQFPVSTKTHVALDFHKYKSNYPDLDYGFDENALIILQREFEILDYNLEKNAEKLYLMVNGKKSNIPTPLKNAYQVVSICLCIPFWNNLDNDIKKELYSHYTDYVNNLDTYLEIEDDIWNMFNNVLPVKVVVL